MKKLLILLTLGLMFGQTKLETRVYELPRFNFNGASYETLSLSQITGFDLDYAILDIVYVSDFQVSSSTASTIRLSTIWGNGSSAGIEVHLWSNGAVNYLSTYENIHYTGNEIALEQSDNSHTGYADLFLSVTAEFPDMDTGYMEEDFDFCINEGLNLVSYPCENDIAINDALPSEISNNLSSIVGEGVAGVNNNGTWVGSLTELQSGSGYWFNSSIEACFNYECAEN